MKPLKEIVNDGGNMPVGNIQFNGGNFAPNLMNHTGWICPQCNGIMAPSEKVCHYCKPSANEDSKKGDSECLLG